MRVSDILRSKGDEIVTITPEATLADASRELASRKFGALVVSTDGETIAGILSERDIVRVVAEQGAAALDTAVSDAMTAEVRTCTRADSLEDLMRVMTEHRIRHLPVVDDARLCGVVSIGDVVKRRVEQLENETKDLHEYIQGGR